jgi:hypothetical protein
MQKSTINIVLLLLLSIAFLRETSSLLVGCIGVFSIFAYYFIVREIEHVYHERKARNMHLYTELLFIALLTFVLMIVLNLLMHTGLPFYVYLILYVGVCVTTVIPRKSLSTTDTKQAGPAHMNRPDMNQFKKGTKN